MQYFRLALHLVVSTKIQANSNRKKPIVNKTIPPDQCLFEGEIVKILPIDAKAQGVCSKNPCEAIVKIIKVIGFGSSFKVSMSSGSKKQIKFKNTLNPTNKLFEDREEHLPGLKAGDKFKAYVTAKTVPLLIIENYTVISKNP